MANIAQNDEHVKTWRLEMNSEASQHERDWERRQSWPRWRRLLCVGAIVVIGVLALVYLFNFPLLNGWFQALAWLFGIVYCLVLFLAISNFISLWRSRLNALGAMWRPWAVVLVAGYFLYFVPQGRELGASLMIGDEYWFLLRAGSLLFALVYWALNGWLSARRGLKVALDDGAIGVEPQPEMSGRKVATAATPWLFWGPRFVGVCAHLAAAFSLGLAARRDFGDGWLGLLPSLAASIFIVIVIYYVHLHDARTLSQRGKGGRRIAPPIIDIASLSAWQKLEYGLNEVALAVKAVLYAFKSSGSFLVGWAIFLVGLTVIAAVLVGAFVPKVSVGFVVASGAISLSALVYLMLISASHNADPLGVYADKEERDREEAAQTREVTRWTVALIMPAVLAVLAGSLFPTWLGRTFGSMVIAFFAFGAFLAFLNFFEWSTQRRDKTATLRLRAYVTAGVTAFCIVNAWIMPFHRVRHFDEDRKTTVDARPNVETAAQVWYAQAKVAYRNAHADKIIPIGEKAPLLVVATAGGGIRAAYWTASVLDLIGKGDKSVSPYIFAISGVSGGSVGATAFAASLKDLHECNIAAASKAHMPPLADCRPGEWVAKNATEYLRDDFLAPALTSWLFKDTLASLLPWESDDRAVALEHGIEAASGKAMAESFIDLRKPPDHADPATFWSPILLLNATHEQTGKRIIASQARVERQVFVDALDELDVLGHDLRASTASVNSARFTYVSPAGDLGGGHGTLIDGGYFENFGALTALEIALAAEEALPTYIQAGRAEYRGTHKGASEAEINSEWPDVKLIVVMITSDPDLIKTSKDKTLDAVQPLVRIDRSATETCVANVTEHGRAHPDLNGVNYLPPFWRKDATEWPEIVANGVSEVFQNSWVNDFVAPFQGLQAVREAHGNRAASQLALQVCTEYRQISQNASTGVSASGADDDKVATEAKPAKSAQTVAGTASSGKNANAEASTTEPAKADLERPYFVHFGMCKKDPSAKVDIDPPLGWVLSKPTREGLDGLICGCGNRTELSNLHLATRAEFEIGKRCGGASLKQSAEG